MNAFRVAHVPPVYPVAPIAVGRYLDAAGHRQPLAYSLMEAERARLAASRVLSSFHFRTGGNMLITSMWDETAHWLPVERAVMAYGMVAVSADSSLFDAARVESIARRFELKGAIGVTRATLEGLTKLGHEPARVFDGLIVWAHPEAYEALAPAGNLAVHRCLEIGPALAMECAAQCGAHLDRHEWTAEVQAGELLLSSRLERSESFVRLRTGLRGRVEQGVCACGNADPRIVLTD